jgi:hypothetical protein
MQGVSYPKMMRAIKSVVVATDKESLAYVAMRIVRTEGQRAQNIGQQQGYERARELGVNVIDTWDATLDSRVRDDHAAMDGKKSKVDSNGNVYFDTPVGRAPGPMRSGVASFDINCRCRTIGIIEGYEPEVKGVRDKGLLSADNYSKYRASFNRARRAK